VALAVAAATANPKKLREIEEIFASAVGDGVELLPRPAELPDVAAWTAVSVASSQRRDTRRVGKYLAPTGPGAPLPTLFLDANYYALHFCMLKQAFAPLFPGFSFAQYQQLVYRRAGREMIAGTIYEFIGDELPVRYGFTVETPDDPGELLNEPEVYAIAHQLGERFGPGALGFVCGEDAAGSFGEFGGREPGVVAAVADVVFDDGPRH